LTEQLTTSEHYRNLSFDEVLEQGIERGLEQGIERGLEQGIEQGIKIGELRGKIELLNTELKALEEGPLRTRFELQLTKLKTELVTLVKNPALPAERVDRTHSE
jgi:flagellar biosynthesis/type III secretory pathway protein FliH